MSNAAAESKAMVERNDKQLKELEQVLTAQRQQIKEFSDELRKLGLDPNADIPMDNLTKEQRAQLEAMQADVERLTTDMKPSTTKPMNVARINKVMA